MPLSNQCKEIIYYLVNSMLAAALVFLGACSDGRISKETLVFAAIAAGLVAIVQFKKYWESQEEEYNPKKFKRKGLLFSFV